MKTFNKETWSRLEGVRESYSKTKILLSSEQKYVQWEGDRKCSRTGKSKPKACGMYWKSERLACTGNKRQSGGRWSSRDKNHNNKFGLYLLKGYWHILRVPETQDWSCLLKKIPLAVSFVSFFFVCLFFLDSTCKWNPTVFIFLCCPVKTRLKGKTEWRQGG